MTADGPDQFRICFMLTSPCFQFFHRLEHCQVYGAERLSGDVLYADFAFCGCRFAL